MHRPRHLLFVTPALAALAGLVAAGCSSGASKKVGAGAAPAAAAAPQTKQPSGAPIKVGYINNEGGAALSVPELRIGAQVGAGYVNSTLGGVASRPIQIVPCVDDGSPEKAIDCANQMVEAKVVAAVVGTDLGADSMLPILKSAGIPLVGHIQLGVAQQFDANAFFFGAAALSYGNAAMKFYAGQGAKRIEWFIPDAPSFHQLSDSLLTPAASAVGIKYKSVYYNPTSPNWSVLAATAVTDRPDVSGSILGTDGVCAAFVSALRDAGYQGHILAASCNGLYAADGNKAVGVDTDSDHWNPLDAVSAPSPKQQDIVVYTSAMKTTGHRDLVNGNAVIGFADIADLAKVMGTIQGSIEGPTVAAALQGTKGVDSFDGPAITCDHTLIKGDSACSNGLLFYRIQQGGSVKAVTPAFVAG